MGYDLSQVRARSSRSAACSASMRARGYHVIHTREGHRPDLPTSDNKRWRSRRIARRHRRPRSGRPILVRGEPGWEIIPELAPLPGEPGDRQAGQGLVLRHRPRADAPHPRHPQPDPHRHHHRRLRPHHHARGQRSRLRVPARRGLLRRHGPRQPPRRDQDGEDAGRRVRRGSDVVRASWRRCHEGCFSSSDGAPLDPLPTSPFQGEGALGQRRRLLIGDGSAQAVQPASPPPERGEAGEGVNSHDELKSRNLHPFSMRQGCTS